MIFCYREKEHYPMISSWFVERSFKPLSKDLLPRIGFVALDVAAGFLYQTDSKLGYIENYISNPKIPRSLRDLALDEITKAILVKADQLKLKLVLGVTSVPAISERAKRLGFEIHPKPQTLLIRRF